MYNSFVGYVAWRGRYYANTYESFEHFLQYVLAQVMGRNSLPHPDPWEPEFDLESSYSKWLLEATRPKETNDCLICDRSRSLQRWRSEVLRSELSCVTCSLMSERISSSAHFLSSSFICSASEKQVWVGCA